MPIQFHKVTWYSKSGTVVVAIAVIFFCFYVNEQYKEVMAIRQSAVVQSLLNGIVSSDGDVAVPAGGSAVFDGLKITFDKVIQDNRCPVDVKCIRAGSVTAHIIVNSSGSTEDANLISDAVPYHFSNYLVSFTHTGPIKYSKVEIDPKNYTAVFHVTNILSS